MILDPYMQKAISNITSVEIINAFNEIYPSYEKLDVALKEDVEFVDNWLKKVRKRLTLGLSTGGTNSTKGIFTCALLHSLGVKKPKSTRTRWQLAWAILDSPIGQELLGTVPELEEERRLGEKLNTK